MNHLSRRSVVVGGLALTAAYWVQLPTIVSAERAVAARRFSDSVGICTHPNWRSTLWGSSEWEAAFLETGVRHTRGKIGRGGTGRAALEDLQQLFDRGVKICATVAAQDSGLDREGTSANIEFLADNVGQQNISGIESANEYNKPSDAPEGWAIELREFQQWLHDSVRADPRLAGVPLVAPSIWGRRTDDYLALGNLEPNVDFGNLHYYTGGRRPTLAGLPRTGGEGGGGGQYAMADAIREARVLAPTKPLWITEYGYPVAGPGLPLSGTFITETAAAKYLIRGLFDVFGEGVERTYIYSLIDDVHRSPPRYHGLMDGSLNPRLTYRALQNLMALFSDIGAGFTIDSLDYDVANAGERIKRQLFQKSDGSFLLVMYQDVDSYDRRTREDIDVEPVNVSLSFAQPPARVEVFTPTTSSAARQSEADAGSLNVPVPDHVTVVKITP